MKQTILFIAILAVAAIAAESHASVRCLQWVQDQNVRDNKYGIRFAAEGATLVVYDANINRGAWDVSTIATEPRYSHPIRRAGFRKVRAGDFVEIIQ